MRAAIFFERDGVLNLTNVAGKQQVMPRAVGDFHINPDALQPLRQLKEAGFLLISVTNQPEVSRGNLSRRELDLMHQLLRTALPLDDILVCPHDQSDNCPCRKPKPGLLTEAAFKWHLDLDRCFVVSDKWHDAEAARLAGCTSLLLTSPWTGSVHRDFLLPDLAAVATKINHLQQGRQVLVA